MKTIIWLHHLTQYPQRDLDAFLKSFNLVLLLCIFRSFNNDALRSMPQDGKSMLVQVMAWCHQAASHYLSQCWPSSMLPYSITRPQRVHQTIWCWNRNIPGQCVNIIAADALAPPVPRSSVTMLLTTQNKQVLSRDHFAYAPSQWKMTLHCNIDSHWLGAYTKRFLSFAVEFDYHYHLNVKKWEKIQI